MRRASRLAGFFAFSGEELVEVEVEGGMLGGGIGGKKGVDMVCSGAGCWLSGGKDTMHRES